MTVLSKCAKPVFNCRTIYKICGLIVFFHMPVMLTGCGSSATTVKHPKKQPTPVYTTLPVQQVVVSGISNTYWDISSINGAIARNYSSRPYLYFSSMSNQLSGSTGCNTIYGKYNDVNKQLKLDALAGHNNCGGALAQEAELMDVLARVAGYQLNQNSLHLFDANKKVVVIANKRL